MTTNCSLCGRLPTVTVSKGTLSSDSQVFLWLANINHIFIVSLNSLLITAQQNFTPKEEDYIATEIICQSLLKTEH